MSAEEPSAEQTESSWRERTLRSDLRLQANAIILTAHDLRDISDFPTQTPRKLCSLIEVTARHLRDGLPSTPRDQLQHVAFIIQTLGDHLRYVQRSSISDTPWSLVQALEHFLKQFVVSDVSFIIRPRWSYMYSLTGDFASTYRSIIQSLPWIDAGKWSEGLDVGASDRIYCLSFPSVEKLNILLHANWGHEVGHIFAAQWRDQYFASLWLKYEPAIKEQIRQDAEASAPDQGSELFNQVAIRHQTSVRTNLAMEIARDGLVELICDSIGVHLFGPAAILALAAFAASRDLDANPLTNQRYPPWRFRLRRAIAQLEPELNELETLGDASNELCAMLDWIKSLSAVCEQTDDLRMVNDSIITTQAYRLIDAEWVSIRAQALAQLPDAASAKYRLPMRINALDALCQRLRADVPPNEFGTWPNQIQASLPDIRNSSAISNAWTLTQPDLRFA